MNREQLTSVIVAATQARNDVRAYKKRNNVSPRIEIASVKTFQQLDGKLSADGKWGPNTVEAAKFYLSAMSDNEVPGFHPGLGKTSKGKAVEITWTKPFIEKEKVEEKAIKAEPEKIKVVAKPKAKAKKKAKTAKKGGVSAEIMDAFGKLGNLTEALKTVKADKHGKDPILNTNSIDAEDEIVENVVKQNSGLTKADIKSIIKSALKSNTSDKEIIKLLKSIKSELIEHRGIVENKSGKLKKDLRLMGLILN